MTREKLARIDNSDIFTFSEDKSAFFFAAGMMIDADGAFRAYHPEKEKGLDYLDNAGEPGNWWALVTDTGRSDGNPIVQKASDPALGYYVSTTSLEDKTKDRTDPRRYVDAESIPFVVLPGNSRFGASLGDFGFTVNPTSGLSSGCVFADTGPSGKIGEGSIALAKELGIVSSPKNGGIGHGIAYVVFPGSKTMWPLSAEEIVAKAAELFETWGGIARLKEALPELSWKDS